MSQAQYKKRLKLLMSRPENQVCSDCPERQPRWASLIVPPPGSPPGSLPIGAFCCLECSGSHRRLGVHISFVRSINLDSWKEKEVLAMENGGNKKVNAIFEARLGQAVARKLTTAADGPTRERFIRDKYERRKYYDASVFETYQPDEEDVAPAPSRRTTKVSRQPSEAARLRAESRRARGVDAAPKPTRAAVPPPAPVAAEVDLLDFAAFDSPAPAPVAPAPAAPTSPNLDLFTNMSVSVSGSAPAVAAPASPAQPMRKSNDDILAMFSQPSSTQTNVMGSPAVAMGTANGGVMMAGVMPQQNAANPMMMANNNMVMMQGGQQPNMAMMGQPNMMPGGQQPNMVMMQGNGFGNNVPQQNGGTMFMQNNTGNAMFMQKQGNNTLMVQKNNTGNVMMMQQGQPQPNPNAMQMMQQASNADDFGFPQAPMGSGPPIAQNGGQFYDAYSQQQQQQAPQQQQSAAPSEDPFASFGQNVFR